MIACIC